MAARHWRTGAKAPLRRSAQTVDAWHGGEVNNPDCSPQAIVIRDLVSGRERRISVDDRSGYSPAGPWWQSDSRTVLFGAANQALDGSTVVAVALDADRARSISDGIATSFKCASNTTELAFASQTFGSSGLVIATTGNSSVGFPILQCAGWITAANSLRRPCSFLVRAPIGRAVTFSQSRRTANWWRSRPARHLARCRPNHSSRLPGDPLNQPIKRLRRV